MPKPKSKYIINSILIIATNPNPITILMIILNLNPNSIIKPINQLVQTNTNL